jgi:PAS domain S-box-containing protein
MTSDSAGSADIERRLRAEVELERNRLRESFAQAPAAMAIVSGPDHRYQFVNAAYVEMSGRPRDQLIAQTVREAFPELEDQGYLDLLDRVYETGEPFVAVESLVNVNSRGTQQAIYMDFTYHPLRDLEGSVEGILFQGVDVTEKVLARTLLESRVEERTAELKKAQVVLRALNESLQQAQEEEQRRLALELHDSAGQLLTALKWKVAMIQNEVGPENTELVRLVRASMGLLEELSGELRTITYLLHPAQLGEAGLPRALRHYVEGLAERSGLRVMLDIDPDLERLPRKVERTVFRIIQESLTNVYRHAKTKSANVRISQTVDSICVQISDKGLGIAGFALSDQLSFKAGVGIQGMRERVRQLNGSFEVESGDGGTAVTAILPKNVPV